MAAGAHREVAQVTRGVVLVTGGSAGLGAEIAKTMASRGWRVWAGSRRGTAAEPGIHALRLNVTDPSSVSNALSETTAAEGRLDCLVCNAGINVSAPAEELPLELARAIVETNLWGVIHCVRAALPHLRETRGRILVIGSLAGLVGPPGEAFYAASKHGLRGFLESLQYETRPMGVKITLVEPGFIRTELAAGAASDWPQMAQYDRLRAQLSAHWRQAIAGGMPPARVAVRVARLAEQTSPPFRTRIGRDGVWVPRLKAVLPTEVFFGITSARFGIGGRRA